MPTRKITIYILIAIVVFGVFFNFYFIKIQKARAETQMCYNPLTGLYGPCAQTGGRAETTTPGGPSGYLCIPLSGSFSLKGCLFFVSYYVIWKPATLFMDLGGLVLNKSIELSITKSPLKYLTESKDSAVSVGWGVARDIVNLFLIFILLYIAIATILQVAGYGAKELLLTLIIIAFLVNFSLVITKLIIDASNVLAVSFYNTFPKGTDGGIKISEGFKTALGLEKIAIAEDAIKEADGGILFLATIFGAAIALIAGFIFLVFSALFFIRMVVLMILMIFAPLAFAAHILPSTKQHASKWWSTLFNQSFFAPAALFMLWLSAKIANSGFIENSLGIKLSDKGIADMFKTFSTPNDPSKGDIVVFTVQYIIIAIVLCASLVIAKQMGAMGANTVISGAHNARKKIQGYAGAVSKKYGARYAASAAEKVTKGEGRIATALRKIPFVTRGLAKVPAAAKAEVGEYEKKYDSYSDATLKNLSPQLLTNRAAQAAILNILTKRGDLKEQGSFTKEHMKTVKDRMESMGISVKDVQRLRPDIAPDMNKAVASQRPEDITKLDKSLATNPAFINAAINNYKPGQLQKLVERGDEIFDEYVNTLKALAGGSDRAVDIAAALRTPLIPGGPPRNEGAARWMESGAGKMLFGWT